MVDGLVRRNADGKETRFICKLTDAEVEYARDVVEAFGQRVCGFDLLRCEGGSRSMVIDVNGWSFVKGNQAYYDKAAEILSAVCEKARQTKVLAAPTGLRSTQVSESQAAGSSYSTLRATVTGEWIVIYLRGVLMASASTRRPNAKDETQGMCLCYRGTLADSTSSPFRLTSPGRSPSSNSSVDTEKKSSFEILDNSTLSLLQRKNPLRFPA